MDTRCSKDYIIMDVLPVVAFFVTLLLFRKHIPNVGVLGYIYLAGVIIMGIALIIKVVLNITRVLQGETPKGLDDAFPLVMGPGILAILISSFYSIFVDDNNYILFHVYGKPPQAWFLLLFALCMAARLITVWRLQKKQIKTTGNRLLKVFDCAAMIFLLVFAILSYNA
ncbi:MAG: hypothetical protein IKZ95_02790 [Lachnospiraceae bacterium]|nr:hypothetical protein [Lachnospiraceae bacterium]